nr:hypothetical protein [Pirellula staleyi]
MISLLFAVLSFFTFSAATTSVSAKAPACCCGASCVCETCQCVELGCSCDKGGDCLCETCTPACCPSLAVAQVSEKICCSTSASGCCAK